MALQSSGQISLADIAGEFGGAAPHSLSEYYGAASGVPTSGAISLSNFYGTSAGPDGTLLYTLNNPNAYSTSADDFFGSAVAISSNYAIVGAYQEDDSDGGLSGKAYIFNLSTGTLSHTLNNPDAYGTGLSDYFGRAVSISDSYAIVGAYQEDDAGGANSGKAYIFNPSTGALLRTLNNPNAYSGSADDYFGYAVGISSNYAIVGAYQEDDVGGSSSGKAYIFNPSTGALLHTLNNPNAYGTSASDRFGRVVAISDSYAVVGADQEDPPADTDGGVLYIFNPSTGALLHALNHPNPYSTSSGDRYPSAVAVSGDYVIAGDYGEEDAAGNSGSGRAYIFNASTGTLLHTLDNPNPYSTSTSDSFGVSVGISGNYAIVGASLEDETGGVSSGKAYIFDVSTGTLVYTLNNPNAYGTSADDRFGTSVAISGNYSIVGAFLEDDAGGTGSGKAYIFK